MINTYYTVSISLIGGAGTSDGFIDNTKMPKYMANGSVPTTATQSINKVRANHRFDNMVANLGLMSNCYLSSISATGANAIAQATTFAFTLESEHGDAPLVTPDENNPGQTLSGTAAIKRCVARAITTSWADAAEYYDPTSTTSQGTNNGGSTTSTAVRFGSRCEPVTVGALANSLTTAEAAITVTKVTTL